MERIAGGNRKYRRQGDAEGENKSKSFAEADPRLAWDKGGDGGEKDDYSCVAWVVTSGQRTNIICFV